MERAGSLVGQAFGGAYFSDGWELRVTRRCLRDDLGADPDADFGEVLGLEIVKAFVRERSDKTDSTRQVSPVSCGVPVWVLAHGNDHRGCTWYDEDEHIVWLLAYRRHRSGASDDFFPYAKSLDAADVLLPEAADYRRAILERDSYFAWAVTVETPVLLQEARETPGEHSHVFGGRYGTRIDVEVDPEIGEAITIAFDSATTPWEHAVIIMAVLAPGRLWEMTSRMPSRDLNDGEIAMTVLIDVGE
jgi:hypothetical protein